MRLCFAGLLMTAAMGLSGCGMVVSTKPLFKAGGNEFRPGLWAQLDDGCAIPTDARISKWPECATPFTVAGTVWTSADGKSVQSKSVLSDSDPAILQFEIPADPAAKGRRRSTTYGYAVAKLGADRPIADITLTTLDCPKTSMPGLKLGKRWRQEVGVTENQPGDSECLATTAAAVLAVARTPPTQAATRIVWIADAPVK